MVDDQAPDAEGLADDPDLPLVGPEAVAGPGTLPRHQHPLAHVLHRAAPPHEGEILKRLDFIQGCICTSIPFLQTGLVKHCEVVEGLLVDGHGCSPPERHGRGVVWLAPDSLDIADIAARYGECSGDCLEISSHFNVSIQCV